MGKLKVTIEKGPDLFGAWADNVPGIYGEGETVQETKENLLASIELYKNIILQSLKNYKEKYP